MIYRSRRSHQNVMKAAKGGRLRNHPFVNVTQVKGDDNGREEEEQNGFSVMEHLECFSRHVALTRLR